MQTRISNFEISQMIQMIRAWRMTFFRFRILNWLHWSRDESFWRISELHDCEYARIISRWSWNFVCKACRSSERFVDLMRFSFVSISRRVYIIEDSNLLMKHVWTTFLQKKMFSLKLYWNVSMRWILIEFWIIQMQDHIDISTIDSANLTCDIDVDIVEDVAKSSRFHCTVQILIHYMLLNRKYLYFEALMLIWQSVLFSKFSWIRFVWQFSRFQIRSLIFVVFAKKTSKNLLIFQRFRKLIQMQKSIVSLQTR